MREGISRRTSVRFARPETDAGLTGAQNYECSREGRGVFAHQFQGGFGKHTPGGGGESDEDDAR